MAKGDHPLAQLRFAVFGAGFWSRFQIAAWRELGGVECNALCDRVRARAEIRAREFGIPRVYDSLEELLRREQLGSVDIITPPKCMVNSCACQRPTRCRPSLRS